MNWLTILAACSPVPVIGDLGAALRRFNAHDQVATPLAPMRGSVVIPLTRKNTLVVDEEASFFVGEISIGRPQQTLKVVFDTSSGHVLVPHRGCTDSSCRSHVKYSPWESLTSMDISPDGTAVQAEHRLVGGNVLREGVTLEFSQSDLGEGEVKTVAVRDHVCVGTESAGDRTCVDMAVLAAYKMSELPFQYMPSDGIVGLGLTALAASPLCSFVGRLLNGATNVVPQFGLAFGKETGELHLGGHDLARIASPLQWFPVDHPETGFWQVAIQAVRVGNVTVDACKKGCHGVIDSSVSRLGVQSTKMPALKSALHSVTQVAGECVGPDISFDLGGMELTLRASDYTGRACIPLLGSLDLDEPEFVGVYALGAALLHHYYAAFDWEGLKLGFAPLASSTRHIVAEGSEVLVV